MLLLAHLGMHGFGATAAERLSMFSHNGGAELLSSFSCIVVCCLKVSERSQVLRVLN